MFNTSDAEHYRECAEMHEHLACTTGDLAARKMHLSMAEAFRRKADEEAVIQIKTGVAA